ncbi:hypothetical protein [Spirosoma panaciterrae]|uniref:hypothetical protein n=1 Tax=Spirosoma panaciterrae TaxID=496058 RepID=UPI00037948C5|nr:hypothetical protein [Spirosoma panaciterrae]
MWDTYLYMTLLGVGTGLYLFNYRILTPPLRILGSTIAITWLGTGYSIYIGAVHHKPNIHVYHILIIIQYALYGLMFEKLIDQPLVKRIIRASLVLFALISLSLSLTIQPWNQYNSYATTLFNALIAIWSSYYLWRMFVDIKVEALEQEASFWISTGLLFSSLGSFFAQGLMNYLLVNTANYAIMVYWIHELMDFILFVFFLLAIYIYLRYLPHTQRS